MTQTATSFHFKPVTPETKEDLDRFSQAHGKFRYCSCMRWRFSSSEFSKSTKESRIAALDERIQAGIPVGILAYANDWEEPVGWCSIAPRSTFAALARSRTMPPIDEQPAWSVTCFFIDKRYRRQGLTGELLRAATDYATSLGAEIIEGYPVEPTASSYTYMGSPHTFERANFVNVTPVGHKRQTVRFFVGKSE